MPGVVVPLVVLPECWAADPKVASDGSLVPKHHVLDPICFARGVQHKALVVLSAGIHHLAKRVKTRKHTEKTLVQVLAVLLDIVSEHKDVVCV